MRAELDALKDNQLFRELVATEHEQGATIRRNGRRYVSFSSNDYFGLSQHPAVLAAARDGARRAGAGASALVTGYHPGMVSLGRALAAYKGTQAALVFGNGYMANLGTISALAGKDDLILADKACHACMIDGAVLSGATFRRFRHNDPDHLRQLLAKRCDYRHCLIVSETVFSMDGDRAPLHALRELADTHDAWLLADDAHGLGVTEDNPVHIEIGTLSKGLGSYGGYVCGSQAVIDFLANRARSFMFTTALPPLVTAAAEQALALLHRDAALRRRPLEAARFFTQQTGLPEAQSPIVPLVIGEAGAALEASAQLAEAGFWVAAIRPPTVPPGTARLRFAFSALHEQRDIARLAETIRQHGWLGHTHLQRLEPAC